MSDETLRIRFASNPDTGEAGAKIDISKSTSPDGTSHLSFMFPKNLAYLLELRAPKGLTFHDFAQEAPKEAYELLYAWNKKCAEFAGAVTINGNTLSKEMDGDWATIRAAELAVDSLSIDPDIDSAEVSVLQQGEVLKVGSLIRKRQTFPDLTVAQFQIIPPNLAG
jgi:hypothetical protein